jgi:PIN domain nuclease of toxin-antitoxin system
MTRHVLDASALLALINKEKGQEKVEEILPFSIMSAINVSECAAILNENKFPEEETENLIKNLITEIIPFTEEQAFETAKLRKFTKSKGLSLGDRACLAVGKLKNLPVATADKVWESINCGVKINLIR